MPLEYHLKTLGLNEKQAKCYVALIELGEATAYQIAQKAKLKRPITYVVLDELRKKGLALKVPHAKKQKFIAKSPDELFREQEEKLRDARRALPELLARASGTGNAVKVLYFEGQDGMKDSMEYKIDSLAGKELLAFYGKVEGGTGAIPPLYRTYNERLHKQDTRVRGFAPKHISLRDFREMDRSFGWDIRDLDQKEFSAETSVEIAPEFVRIDLYKHELSVVVDNPHFAKMMREVFEMVWKTKH